MASTTGKTQAKQTQTKEPEPARQQNVAAGTPEPAKMTLQQKMVEIRKAIPSITQAAYSDGVKYKFAKIFDVYKLLAPALNEWRVNFDITSETATHHSENGDEVYYSTYVQHTKQGDRLIWVYEADIEVTWTNADNPEDRMAVTLHAIGTNDSGPDKAKGSAWTYCLKYYLFEKFNIDQGDDDPDAADHSSEARTSPQNVPGGTNTHTSQQNSASGQNRSPQRLSEAQLNRMYRKAEDAGMKREQCDARIRQLYNLEDPAALTRQQYDDICRQLDDALANRSGGT